MAGNSCADEEAGRNEETGLQDALLELSRETILLVRIIKNP